MSYNIPAKLDAILCNQHVLVIDARAGFVQHMPDRSFLVNNFANFPDVQVNKKSLFYPVFGGVSLQQHLLSNKHRHTECAGTVLTIFLHSAFISGQVF